MADAIPMFAKLLKQWRHHRHISQLELALRAGVSQRHVSFLETGRANPSRSMVLALANSMDVPLREQNNLLQSAGFSTSFTAGDLDQASHQVFRYALEQTLDHAEPYPAMVLDGHWNMIMANKGALRFFSLFVDPFQALQDMGNPSHFQIVRLCMHDAGLGPFIENWQVLMASFLGRARRALLANPEDEQLPVLIEEILHHPRAPENWQQIWNAPPAPAMEMIMRRDQQQYRLFTMLAHFGTPTDITLQELSVELFYPADATTRIALEALADP